MPPKAASAPKTGGAPASAGSTSTPRAGAPAAAPPKNATRPAKVQTSTGTIATSRAGAAAAAPAPRTASSTKTQTATGAAVVTFASGSAAVAGAPTVSIEFDPVPLGLAFDDCAVVTKCNESSPSFAAGVQPGWKITKVDGNSVRNSAEVNIQLKAAKKKNKKISIVFESEVLSTGNNADGSGVSADANDQTTVDAAAAAVAESEAKQKAEEEAARIVAEAEAKRARANGEVCLRYNMYDEKFAITNGSTTSAAIDDAYALSFVMPDVKIKLSKLSPKEMTVQALDHPPYIPEEPPGTYQGLEANETYWVYALQSAEALAEEARRNAEWAAKNPTKNVADGDGDGRRPEGCSCLYGNPCAESYTCQDWPNRMAVATKNGWKGW